MVVKLFIAIHWWVSVCNVQVANQWKFSLPTWGAWGSSQYTETILTTIYATMKELKTKKEFLKILYLSRCSRRRNKPSSKLLNSLHLTDSRHKMRKCLISSSGSAAAKRGVDFQINLVWTTTANLASHPSRLSPFSVAASSPDSKKGIRRQKEKGETGGSRKWGPNAALQVR